MALIATDEAVILEPDRPADSAVVWLHGAGTDARDFLPCIPRLGLPPWPSLRWVFPQAPLRAISMNGGARMRAWCDFKNLTRSDQQDEAGIRESARRIEGFIGAQVAAGVAPGRILLGGFSQGGAMALHVGLRHPRRLAGIVALSTYLPLHMSVPAERSQACAGVPILMCHGRADAVLPLPMGSMARDFLQMLGYAVQWHDYPMPHQVCDEELLVIGRWIARQVQGA